MTLPESEGQLGGALGHQSNRQSEYTLPNFMALLPPGSWVRTQEVREEGRCRSS